MAALFGLKRSCDAKEASLQVDVAQEGSSKRRRVQAAQIYTGVTGPDTVIAAAGTHAGCRSHGHGVAEAVAEPALPGPVPEVWFLKERAKSGKKETCKLFRHRDAGCCTNHWHHDSAAQGKGVVGVAECEKMGRVALLPAPGRRSSMVSKKKTTSTAEPKQPVEEQQLQQKQPEASLDAFGSERAVEQSAAHQVEARSDDIPSKQGMLLYRGKRNARIFAESSERAAGRREQLLRELCSPGEQVDVQRQPAAQLGTEQDYCELAAGQEEIDKAQEGAVGGMLASTSSGEP